VVRVSVFLNADLTWFERISMLVILLNCVTLGMYRPCLDDKGCDSNRCKLLQVSPHGFCVSAFLSAV
jgi:voltage-dependent calcium channel T type alpha-1G